jgi:hypothetical protein
VRGLQLWFDGASAGPVHIELFDVRGRRIDAWPAVCRDGRCEVHWTRGRTPASGAYFVRVRSGAATWRAKVLCR